MKLLVQPAQPPVNSSPFDPSILSVYVSSLMTGTKFRTHTEHTEQENYNFI
jgi:hypothetical protein